MAQDTSQLFTPNIKLYAILDQNNIVLDGWLAYSLEEACIDNPGKKIVELNDYNSPQYINKKYSGLEKDIIYNQY